MSFRFDTGTITSKTRTPSGGLRVEARLSRTGVQRYVRADGTVRHELRLPEEVFAPEALASIKGAPVTDGHPPEPVNPSNWKEYAKGHAGDDPRKDGDQYVAASVLIEDADLIAKAEAKDVCEISLGYFCKEDETPGVWHTGERYDVIQRLIRVNHVALLPEGHARGGPNLRLRLDSAACISDQGERPEGAPMIKIILDGKEVVKGSDEHLALLDAKAKADATEITTLRAKAAQDALTIANQKTKIDGFEGEKKKAARAALVRTARGVLGEKYLRDEAGADTSAATDDDTIIRAILKEKLPNLDTKNMDHAALMIALQVAMASSSPAGDLPETPAEPAEGEPPAPPALDSIHAIRTLPGSAQGSGERLDSDASYAKAHKKSADRWKKGLEAQTARK